MPKCIKCQKNIPKGSKFCNYCGAKQKLPDSDELSNGMDKYI